MNRSNRQRWTPPVGHECPGSSAPLLPMLPHHVRQIARIEGRPKLSTLRCSKHCGWFTLNAGLLTVAVRLEPVLTNETLALYWSNPEARRRQAVLDAAGQEQLAVEEGYAGRGAFARFARGYGTTHDWPHLLDFITGKRPLIKHTIEHWKLLN